MVCAAVYFARAGSDGPIKIGITTGDPVARIAALQTGCPWPLVFIGSVSGSFQQEAWLHARFAAERMKGEWFNPSPGLLTAIDEILRPGFEWPTILIAPTKTRGALDAWLTRNALTPAEFGKRIGRTQAAVSRYITGARTPDREAMSAIYAVTAGAVQPNDFYRLPSLSPELSEVG